MTCKSLSKCSSVHIRQRSSYCITLTTSHSSFEDECRSPSQAHHNSKPLPHHVWHIRSGRVKSLDERYRQFRFRYGLKQPSKPFLRRSVRRATDHPKLKTTVKRTQFCQIQINGYRRRVQYNKIPVQVQRRQHTSAQCCALCPCARQHDPAPT